MRKHIKTIGLVLFVMVNITLLCAYDIWSFNYVEDTGLYISQNDIWSSPMIIAIILSLVGAIGFVCFKFKRTWLHRINNIVIGVLIITNLLLLFLGLRSLKEHNIQKYCNQFLSKEEIDLVYQSKVKDIWVVLQKEDSNFESLKIYKITNEGLGCRDRYLFAIKYKEFVIYPSSYVDPDSVVRDKFKNIISRNQYFLYTDENSIDIVYGDDKK